MDFVKVAAFAAFVVLLVGPVFLCVRVLYGKHLGPPQTQEVLPFGAERFRGGIRSYSMPPSAPPSLSTMAQTAFASEEQFKFLMKKIDVDVIGILEKHDQRLCAIEAVENQRLENEGNGTLEELL